MDRSVGTVYDAQRPADDPFPDFPKRITYLIDPEGVVAKVYEVTDAGGHPEEVLSDLRGLAGG